MVVIWKYHIVVLLLIVHTLIRANAKIPINGPRIMISKEEIVLESGKSYAIQCRGEYPLKWVLPNAMVPLNDESSTTQVNVVNVKCPPFSTDQKYCNILRINNLTYHSTGFFSCEYREIYLNMRKKQLPMNSAKIYVYVTDTNHLSVFSAARILSAERLSKSNWILPCRPTFPQVYVLLAKANQYGTRIGSKNYSGAMYNPQNGFVVKNVDHSYFICTYKWNNVTFENFVVLNNFIYPKDESHFEIEFLSPEKTLCIRYSKEVGTTFSLDQLFCSNPKNPLEIVNMGNSTNLEQFGVRLDEGGSNTHSSESTNSLFSLKSCAIGTVQVIRPISGTYSCFLHRNPSNGGPLIRTVNVKSMKAKERFLDLIPKGRISYIHQESYGNITTELEFQILSYPDAKIQWFNNRNVSIAGTDNKYQIRTVNNTKTVLQIRNSTYSDSGIYTVRASVGSTLRIEKWIKLSVDRKPEVFLQIRKSYEKSTTNEYLLNCTVVSQPEAIVQWYFASSPPCQLDPTCKYNEVQNTVRILDNQTQLSTATIFTKYSGIVVCKAKNLYGKAENSSLFTVVQKRTSAYSTHTVLQLSTWLPILITSLLISFTITIYFSLRIRQVKQLQNELDSLEMLHFEAGAPESFNPDVELNQQAEFLPYNRNWEFPVERLKFGRQLGSGAYGVVIQAEAGSILTDETSTTVAVKMPQANTNNQCLRALIGELKILIHLGPHINIVNLLGACTQNIARRELFVIFEYCRFGNVLKFLQNNRENFVDMIDRSTDRIDIQLQLLKNSTYTISTTDSSQGISSRDDSQQEFGICKETNSNSEYIQNDLDFTRGHLVTTKDLVEWSFQVARGMDYLAGKRVLHGDLAARNILLADNNLVKICDFGLSRNLYNYAKYKKRTAEALPMKWLAIETIQDNVFSSKSDVWSFGIVLWEFFSLGMTPYPGLQMDQFLMSKLANGYRMQCPDFSPHFIYDIMIDCWKPLPNDRPTFSFLWEKFYQILNDIRPHPEVEEYLQTNNPIRIESD